ncbi:MULTISPECIES: hypothetical protein [unclassified Exiguobacterium]
MIGTVSVAGLALETDHKYAVRGMERYRQCQN